MDSNETVRILNAETNEQLLKAHADELAKVRKLRLVIKELKQIDCGNLLLPDKEQVEKAIILMKIGEYLYLNDKKEQVLNLEDTSTINLNYTERKALRQRLTRNLQKELLNICEYNNKLRSEVPEVFSETDSLHNQILSLEKQRRSNLESLVQVRNRKCNFLKVAAELKMGPYLACELEVLLANARQNQTKVSLLRGYFINEMLTRTEHNLKAIREVEGYINETLEKEQDISK
ncbi:hypothetical protein DOY81_003474 [Sarcophaga bullata]|nr:hypothetical protein DOY81_003474 [Sarcophaga bullata]